MLSTLSLRTFLLCLLGLAGFAELHAQSCLPQGYTFDSQGKIDSFATNFPSCNRIEGDVLITGNITNLNGLTSLVYLDGILEVNGCSGLQDLTGLGNLKRVGNLLLFYGNADLENLQGLGSLDSVLGQVWIEDNPQLESLLGLDSLVYVDFGLLIINNPRLKNLEGLGGLTYSSLAVTFNDSLISLNGLDALRHLPNNLTIMQNPSLVDLRGLDSIQSIDNSLTIIDNARLQDLSGLSQIKSIKTLYITGNDSLQNLTGLENLVSVTKDVNISANPRLKNLEGLGSLVRVGTILGISQNDNMRNLVGLDSLRVVGGFFSLLNLPSLQNLDGLISLDSLGTTNTQWVLSLNISDNDSLVDITGLASVTYLNKGLVLRNNPLLMECTLDLLCALLPDPLSYNWQINNNGYGCDSRPIIMADCNGTLALDASVGASLAVYPNPADNMIRFDWAFSEGGNAQKISLYNMHGELISQQRLMGLNGSWVWDTHTLPDGVYIYRFDNADLKSGKLVVVHQ